MLRRILRFLGWTFFAATVLLIAVALLVRVPAIQNKIAQKAIAYLEKKIGTKVELERIVINFPKKIVIEGLYLEDLKKDTLLYAGRIGVDASMLKLFRNEIELSQVEISDATANVFRTLPDSAFNFDYIIHAFAGSDTTATTPADTTATAWKFSLGDVELQNVRFLYDDNVDTIKVAGFVGSLDVDTDKIDPVNLLFELDELDISNTRITYQEYSLSDINLSVSDIKINSTSIAADFEEFSFKEKSGLALQKLVGKVKLSKTEAELESIELLLGNTHLFVDGRANLKDSIAEISLGKSQISIDDILAFDPTMLDSLPVKIPKGTIVSIEAKAHGSFGEAVVELLELQAFDSTSLSMTGKANFRTSAIDATLKKFYTTMADAKKILPDTLLPDSLELPGWMNLEGKLSGSLKQPIIASKLTSDKGNIVADGTLDLRTSIPSYKAKVTGRSLKAGDLAGQPALGDLNFDLAVDGRGFNTKDLQTKIDLALQDITYNEYTFHDFKVNGVINKFLFSGKATLDDDNLKFVLDGDLDYNGDIPSYKVQFDLENIDFQKLNLTGRPLKARLTVDVDLTTNDFKIMNGRLDIRKVGVFNGEKLYSVDSMLFASLDQEGHSKMSIRSDILTGDFEGSFNVFTVSEVLKAHFQQYFPNGKPVVKAEGPPQNFTFDLKIKNTDLITEVLIPGLEPFTPGVIRGEFDSRESKLDLEFRMPKLRYDGTGVDSLILLVDSDSSEFRYFAKLKNLVADTLTIHEVNIVGAIANDSIRTSFNILDSLEEKKYSIGARVARDKDLMSIRLDTGMVLNSSTWNVPADNLLSVGSGVVAANHFEIFKNKQKVMMIGDTRKDPAITILFEELELSNLTRIIQGVVPASGELNGDFKFTTTASGEFSSNLAIAGLTILQIPIGDLTLGLDHTKDRYNVAMNLRGNRTHLETKGYYGGPKGSEALDLVVDIHQLNMEAVQAFSVGQISNATGLLKGNMTVKGKPAHPDVNGNLTFSEVSIVSTYLNSQFELKNETISIRNDNITLNNFTILDAEDNQAQLKGNIKITNYRNPEFDLTLTTKSFQVLDTHEGDNDLFYGKVKVNTTARISGSADQPKATFKLGFTDDTNLTYIVPTTEKGVLEARGIVNFVDKDAEGDPFLAKLKAEDSVRSTGAGIEVSAVIELTDKEILNIVVDPTTGDKLTVQGNSSLTFDMTSTGNMNLSGRYEITKGSYDISFYNIVKRKFDIEKGSTITWAGDPLNATMDIRASNLVETSPLDLLAVGDASAVNNFNQRLPFLVYLKIKGQLLVPQISFAIDMPADKRNAFGGMLYSKLQDINSRESDLNKQVFALLILKRFVADNPFESSTGGATNTARTSVSRILSEQLNRLSQNVKGIQLSVDIKSYEEASAQGGTQGRTKAQLGVSKSLFGNRLVVKLSGNVDIEGENAGSGDVSDYIGDLALEYKMTDDGRFRVTGFRNSNYDMIDGELTETGAGLIYIKDYNTLRELFKANEKGTP